MSLPKDKFTIEVGTNSFAEDRQVLLMAVKVLNVIVMFHTENKKKELRGHNAHE
jgi:hypothetical protein